MALLTGRVDANKVDKVDSAVSGNFAGLDANGNLTDSGSKPSDFATTSDITYETLNTNGDVGTSAGQLAIGNHNHSGVYEPADATILKDADIGVSVQGYNAANALTSDITYEQLNTNGDVGTGAGQLAIGDHNHTGVYEPANANIQSHISDTANPHSVTKSQVGLGSVQNILSKFDATTAPTTTDDTNSGYSVGSVWVDVTNDESYTCVDATASAAVWENTSGGGAEWGLITGTLSSQTDLQSALDGKSSTSHNHDSDYISIVSTPTTGNFPVLTVGGELNNSAYGPSSFATSAQGTLADSATQPGDNISTLTNDSAFITASSVTYETLNTNGDVGTGAGQLAIGDHNHSGVYEPADATILKDADIGVNVQAYDTDLTTLGGLLKTAGNTIVANGSAWTAQKNELGKTTAPTTSDDSGAGYVVGSRWIDITNDKEYVCLDNTLTAAVWTETTSAAGGAGDWGSASGDAFWATYPTTAAVTATAAVGTGNLSIGDGSVTDGTSGYNIAIGNSRAGSGTGAGSISIGIGNNTTSYGALGSDDICIGRSTASTGTGGYNIVIGQSSTAGPTNNPARSIAIGFTAVTRRTGSIAIGDATSVNATGGIALGDGAVVSFHPITDYTNAIAIGAGATAGAANAISIGPGVSNTTASSINIGYSSGNYFTYKSSGNLSLTGTAAQYVLPSYNSGSEPTGTEGGVVYDTTNNQIMLYNGSGWNAVGGGGYDTHPTTEVDAQAYYIAGINPWQGAEAIAVASSSSSDNVQWLVPVMFTQDVTLDKLNIVTGSSSGGAFRFAVYSNTAATAYPTTKLYESSEISAAAINTIYTASAIALPLSANTLYWVGIWGSQTTAKCHTVVDKLWAVLGWDMAAGDTTIEPFVCYRYAATYSAGSSSWPSTWASGTAANAAVAGNNLPAIYMNIA